MLRVSDGLRTLDGANFGCDIPPANYAAANTMNGTGVDMAEHFEFLAFVQSGVHTSGDGVVAVQVQESNEAAANFANVSGASVSLNANNTSKGLAVDWRHPDRKRYARVQGITATNAVIYGVNSVRVMPHGGDVDVDDSIDQT